MEKRTCKLCFRQFANGRALGGHMRSHVAAGAVAPARNLQVEDSSASLPSSSSSVPEEAEQVEGDDGKGTAGAVSYRLRENPRKSFKVVDPEFSSSTFLAFDFATARVGSSIVVQDPESETESSKSPFFVRRFKRPSRSSPSEAEPLSSVSGTTSEEDGALCLMLMSRSVWTTKKEEESEEEEQVEESEGSDEEEQIAAVRSRRSGRSKYQCGTCRKVFRSYQALGGHRASHKKVRGWISGAGEADDSCHEQDNHRIEDVDSKVNADRKIHQCPVCFRVFGSGQALGGHKRSHLISSYSPSTNTTACNLSPLMGNANGTATAATSSSAAAATSRLRESLIDLNQPAPMEEDATSRVELSTFFDN